MFTFIKRLQELSSHLKKNKGLWFTILFIISVIGIFVSMYIIMTMADRVSQKVHHNMLSSYELKLNAKIQDKHEEFKKIETIMKQNEMLLSAVESNNGVILDKLKKSFNEEFLKNGFDGFSVDFISVAGKDKPLRNTLNTVVSSKKSLFGIEVLENGIFFIYMVPFQKNEATYGVLEIKESVHILRKQIAEEGSEYLFLLDKKMMPSLSLEEKMDKYKEVNDNYSLKQAQYNTKFATTLHEVDFEKLKHVGYVIDDNYFRMIKKITDINGVDVGLMVVGESVEASGGFVNIASDMTNTVTTVALGLVISIILFLF